jgi:hypothetical protein
VALSDDARPEFVEEALSSITSRQCAVASVHAGPCHYAFAARMQAVNDSGVERLAVVVIQRDHCVFAGVVWAVWAWFWFVHTATIRRSVATTK